MHCVFEIRIADTEHSQASIAVQSCFDLLDRMESELSRFIESSEIDVLRHARAGDFVNLHPWAWECLLMAESLNRATGGAFDPFYLSFRDYSDTGKVRPVRFYTDTHQVEVMIDNPEAGLGAIGKGYALDKMAELLEAEWNITRCLLISAGSTHLAVEPPLGKEGWAVNLFGDSQRKPLMLKQQSLSSSGTLFQGDHIKIPTGSLRDSSIRRVWALASCGALADALSTSFFLLTKDHILDLAGKFSANAYLEYTNGVIESF